MILKLPDMITLNGTDAAYRERAPGWVVIPFEVLAEAGVIGIPGKQMAHVGIAAGVLLHIGLFDQIQSGIGRQQDAFIIDTPGHSGNVYGRGGCR